MIFHENRLLSCNSIPYFCGKLGKMSQNLSPAAVVICPLRVKNVIISLAIYLDLVLGAQKNCLIEMDLLSTHNICFG